MADSRNKTIIDTDPGIGKFFSLLFSHRLCLTETQIAPSLFISILIEPIFQVHLVGAEYFTDEVSYISVDDAMAIFLALQSPELDVLGLTTIFGNVYTTLSTRNALHLVSHL